ncbi:MAG: outer membrane protein assembly factor BamE [Pseudomonadota bacterium]
MAVMLSACAATFQNHGFVPPEDELETILPGVDTRDSLALSVGQPSASGVIRDDAWFYAAYRVRNFAYQAPQVIERDIVAISFDEDGVVSNVERFGLEDGQIVQLSRRVTDSGIGDVTLLTQILRNFGRLDVGNIIERTTE